MEMIDDLISRSALLEAYDKAHKGPPGGARKLIEEAPEAVIRCKDCKFRQSRVSRIIDGIECNLCEIVKGYKSADWFCGDGKRRDDDG